MCLGVGHRVGDRTSVNIQQGGPFRLGRRQGPGDRQRLVGRKRHVDKTDRRAGGVDLPAVIRLSISRPVARRPLSGLHISSGVASRCAGTPSAALNRLRAPSTTAAGTACRRLSGVPPSARFRPARSGSRPPRRVVSDRDRTLRRRCGSRCAFCARLLRYRQAVSHSANSQCRPGSAAGRDWRCRGVRPRPARGRAATRRPCRLRPGDPP